MAEVEPNKVPVGDDGTRLAFVRIAEIQAEVTALDRFINSRIDGQADKVALALTASDRAITKAEDANEKRFASVNEFRNTLSDQAKTLVSRAEFDQLSKSLTEKIDVTNKSIAELRSRLDVGNPAIGTIQSQLADRAGRDRGAEITIAKMIAVVGVAVAILTFVVYVANMV